MRARLIGFAFLALAACSPAVEKAEAPAEPALAATELNVANVTAPIANARVTSPINVTGTAPANWFFENQFPVRLVDAASGAEITMAPAHPRVSWTEPGDKVFDATISFTVNADTNAILVLQEDMPGENETPRETRVPVVLTRGG